MKLIIQIPCYNEAETLRVALDHLPRKIDGVDEIEVLIINDGSTDRTVEVAREWGVKHIVSFKQNRGLARGFMAGIDACLHLGADIIVNTDADDQYRGEDIERLVRPILEKKADIVIGERTISSAAMRCVRGVTLPYRKHPVSVHSPVNRQSAISGVISTFISCRSRKTISQAAAAPGST